MDVSQNVNTQAEDARKKTKTVVFWFMLSAGILYLLATILAYIDSKVLSARDTAVSLVLIGLAILYKFKK